MLSPQWDFLCWKHNIFILNKGPGGWFNIEIQSYQYRKSQCGDQTVIRSSYLHNGISYTGKTTSLYWIRALVINIHGIIFCPEYSGFSYRRIAIIISMCLLLERSYSSCISVYHDNTLTIVSLWWLLLNCNESVKNIREHGFGFYD